MKLNKQGRDEIRAQVEEQLKNVPDGQRIHLDKELLEQLLFETITLDNITIKIPFWFGTFLSKIDLSEVDFEDVSWTIISNGIEIMNKLYDYEYVIYKKSDLLIKELKLKTGAAIVDYSNTNIKPDFKKSAEAKYSKDGLSRVWNTNFCGVDLSYVNFDYIFDFFECDLSDTNIKITMDDINKHESITNSHYLFSHCNLKNIDLSKIIVDVSEIIAQFWDTGYFEFCKLKNTGLKITLNLSDEIYSDFSADEIAKYKKLICTNIKEGNFGGCYINGKLMHSMEEREQIAQRKREEYTQYKDIFVSDISDSINEQIGGIKK